MQKLVVYKYKMPSEGGPSMNYNAGVRNKSKWAKIVGKNLLDYSWVVEDVKLYGFDIFSRKSWLYFMNNLLYYVPAEAWAEIPTSLDNDGVRTYKGSKMSLELGWVWPDGIKPRRSANLCFACNDHTAWVMESTKKHNVWVNFDIGGS